MRELEFTPETLRTLATKTDELRMEVMFKLNDSGSDPMAEQHALIAMTALEQAERHFKLAAMLQSAALARWGR